MTMSIDRPPGGGDNFFESEVSSDKQMLDGHQDENFQAGYTEYFPGATKTYSGGSTFTYRFNMDKFSSQWTLNIYYPFASRGDWELGSWLLHSGLSMSTIDSLLSLILVRVSYLEHQIRCSQ